MNYDNLKHDDYQSIVETSLRTQTNVYVCGCASVDFNCLIQRRDKGICTSKNCVVYDVIVKDMAARLNPSQARSSLFSTAIAALEKPSSALKMN